MEKILTALSGGVDSAVAAALLLRQGFAAGGAVMLLQPHADAEAAARRLGIPFHRFAWQENFRRAVIEPFAAAYRRGETPNPCIFCNRALKFGKFLQESLALGYDGMATGHYARLQYDRAAGRWLLYTARDTAKDQTYMLAQLTQDQLARVRLPLGELTKDEVRARAAEYGLWEQQGKRDSQDICFVPDGDYLAYLTAHGLTPQPGRFRGEDGQDLGPHRGYEGYTIGQRRGLGLAAGRRVYVLAKPRPDVVVGDAAALYTQEVRVGGMNWVPFARPAYPLRAQAKLRYTARPADCTVDEAADGVRLTFPEPQRAVTPGQAAVLYDGELVLGGGTIL